MSAAPTAPALKVLACPRCGGAPDPEGGPGHLARCRSCGVLGLIDDPERRHRLAIMPAVDRAFATDSLRARLRERGATGRFSLHAQELIFVPFWRVRTLLVGLVEGRQPRSSRSLERVTAENGQSYFQFLERNDGDEAVSKEIQKTVLSVISACPLEEYGLPTLDRRRQSAGALAVKRSLDRLGEVVVFHPGLRKLGAFLDPLFPIEKAEDEAEGLLEAQKEGMTAGLLPGATLDTAVLERDTGLVFFPVFLLRFQQGSTRGSAAVDASSGEVVSIRLPPTGGMHRHDRRIMILLALAGGLLTTSLARIALIAPRIFQGENAEAFRVKLLLAAILLGVASWAGLKGMIRYLGGRLR